MLKADGRPAVEVRLKKMAGNIRRDGGVYKAYVWPVFGGFIKSRP